MRTAPAARAAALLALVGWSAAALAQQPVPRTGPVAPTAPTAPTAPSAPMPRTGPAATPATGEAEYTTRDNGGRCARPPCPRWDVRNAATRERRTVARIDLSALRLNQQATNDLMADLAEGRFVVRGAIVAAGQGQPAGEALRVTRVVSVTLGTIATRFPAPAPQAAPRR
ncbi:MAG: hypothetical protein JNL66_14655 [Alphaproteobacteria bacterium]|nr:hypothetical protein [Alphaproteobacteria bacterium]